MRRLERTPDGDYICKPILSIDAVLSRFAEILRNLNQRRENDATANGSPDPGKRAKPVT
uniref:Uncharacterized protein n=1 Tax=mine drainage metagenome TaxID=410659 RepID=E6QUY5_9ZZZZ